MTNLEITRQVAPFGCYYAPDPSSQQVCSIGGNIAENSGGAHCLKYGFTVHHVLGVEAVLPNGELVHIGGADARHAGPRSARRAGRLGRHAGRRHEGDGAAAAAARGGADAARGLRLDRRGRRRGVGDHRARHRAGGGRDDGSADDRRGRSGGASEFPDTDAVLIVELDGPQRRSRRAVRRSSSACATQCGATTIEIARDAGAARADLEGAEGGVRRDGPRVAELLRAGRRRAAHEAAGGAAPDPRARGALGLRIGNVFHAGDGNLHPLICYDEAIPGQAEHAEEVASEILRYCIEAGGAITGEHGVGADKKAYMPKMFARGRSRRDAARALRVRSRRDLQSRQGVSDAAAVRRSARVRIGSIRSSGPAWPSVSDGACLCSNRFDAATGGRACSRTPAGQGWRSFRAVGGTKLAWSTLRPPATAYLSTRGSTRPLQHYRRRSRRDASRRRDARRGERGSGAAVSGCRSIRRCADCATIGGIVATNDSGPRRHATARRAI